MTSSTQVLERCRAVARITDVEGETTRTFLSPAMRRTNEQVSAWMRNAGLAVHVDAAGNVRGRRTSSTPGAGTLVIASHLDTVPNAGAFDGVLGVLMGIEVAERLRMQALPFHLEIIGFSEEEGVRFGAPFIGSRALIGTLDDTLLERQDSDGVSVRESLTHYGLNSDIASAQIRNPLAYLEFHLEQGPALENEGLPLGVVEAIAGQNRYELVFHGEANHAGTTPMSLRHDAMAAAAEWIVEVERYARLAPGLVATNGFVQTAPGAGNVVAGEARVSLDVRSALDGARRDAADYLLQHAQQCGSKRGVSVTHTCRMQQDAVFMDATLMRLLEDAVDGAGTVVRRMVSGAGHDAIVVAPHIPSAMLFLRTPRGLSHHPDEAVLPGDVELGLNVGTAFVEALARQEATA